jgi:hypothetical protein
VGSTESTRRGVDTAHEASPSRLLRYGGRPQEYLRLAWMLPSRTRVIGRHEQQSAEERTHAAETSYGHDTVEFFNVVLGLQ